MSKGNKFARQTQARNILSRLIEKGPMLSSDIEADLRIPHASLWNVLGDMRKEKTIEEVPEMSKVSKAKKQIKAYRVTPKAYWWLGKVRPGEMSISEIVLFLNHMVPWFTKDLKHLEEANAEGLIRNFGNEIVLGNIENQIDYRRWLSMIWAYYRYEARYFDALEAVGVGLSFFTNLDSTDEWIDPIKAELARYFALHPSLEKSSRLIFKQYMESRIAEWKKIRPVLKDLGILPGFDTR